MDIKIDNSNLLKAPAQAQDLRAPAHGATAPAVKNESTSLNPSNKTTVGSGQPNLNGLDPLELAYIYIFESVQLGHDTAQIQAKGLEVNAAAQNKMIAQEAALKFNTFQHSQLYHKKWGDVMWSKVNWKNWDGNWNDLPRTYKWERNNVKQSVLDSLQFKNQEISAVRGVLEDKLNVLKQNSSIGMTQLNTVSNESQQSLSEGSSLMQMLASLTNQISRI